MNILKIDSWCDRPENYNGTTKYPNGILLYHLNGLLHREDGPAIIHPSGKIYYFLNHNNITEEVNKWIIENNIPKDWNNSHKLLFKLTFG